MAATKGFSDLARELEAELRDADLRGYVSDTEFNDQYGDEGFTKV